MPTVLSEDEFFTGEKSADYSRGQSSPRTISTDEFLGVDPLSREALQPSLARELFTIDPLAAMSRGLKQGAGMAAQVADMALGLPGQAIRVGANIGGRVKALASGGSAADADWAGKALADQVPRSLTNPVGAAMEAFGYGKDYNENDVSHVMEKVMGVVSKGGEWVEEKTGKVLTKRGVEDIFETFMLSLGARGTAHGLDPKLKALGAPEVGDVPRGAGNLDRYTGKPPKGGWRRPIEEPTLGEKPPIPGLDVTEMGPPPAGGVWQFDRAAKPVGEALDLTDEPKLPVGEATEVPNIPTGEALEIPNIPTPQVKTIGGAVGEKMVAKMRQGVVPAAVAGTGLGLAILYPDQKDEALGAAAGALAVGRGKGLTLDAIHALPEATPVKVFRDQSATTLLTLERLPENGYRFRKQTIQDQLKRQDVTKAERELIEGVMKGVEGDTITAKQLYAGVKLKTGDWELTRKETSQWADYGLESVGRVSDESRNYDENGRPLPGEPELTPATTTLYDLPEGVLAGEGQAANHFNDPNYFAHTRSFVEGGVRHVVEIQSDLAQKAGKVLGEEERARLGEEVKTFENIISLLGALRERARNLSVAQFKEIVLSLPDPLPKVLEEHARILSGADKDLAAQDSVWIKKAIEKVESEAVLGVSERTAKLSASGSTERIQPLLKDWYKRVVREELARAARGPERPEYTKAREALKDRVRAVKSLIEENPDRPDLHELWKDQIEPDAAALEKMPRNFPPEAVVRFATADTVAKVEGWREASPFGDKVVAAHMRDAAEHRAAGDEQLAVRFEKAAERSDAKSVLESTLKAHEAKLTSEAGTDPEALAKIPRQMATARADAEKVLAKYGRIFSNPEHAGLYLFYDDLVSKFLRGLGGKPYTDSAGHTWIEVPTEGSKDRPAGPRAQMLGGVDPKLLYALGLTGAGIAAGMALDPDRPIEGAILGAAAGALATKIKPTELTRGARKITVSDLAAVGAAGALGYLVGGHNAGEVAALSAGAMLATKALKKLPADPRVRINLEAGAMEYAIRKDTLEGVRFQNAIFEAVPDEARRVAINSWLDGDKSIKLTPDELKIALSIKGYLEVYRARGEAAGVIKTAWENYAPRVVTFAKGGQSKLAVWLDERMAGGGTGGSSFTKSRTFPTIAELKASPLYQSGDIRLKTEDIGELIGLYTDSISRAIAQKNLVEQLKGMKTLNGDPLIRSVKGAPHTYDHSGHPLMRGLVNHPDISGSLDFILNRGRDPVGAWKAFLAVNSAIKLGAVMFSLFHAMSLGYAYAGAARLSPKTIAAGATLGLAVGTATGSPEAWAALGAGIGMFTPAATLAFKAVSGKHPIFREIYAAGGGPVVDRAMKYGVQFSVERHPVVEDTHSKLFTAAMEDLGAAADSLIPGTGKLPRGAAWAVKGFDKLMWARLHTTLKLVTFEEKFQQLRRNNPGMSERAAGEAAASFTNDSFGGLDWRRIAESAQTQFGRDLAQGLLKPSSRRVAQVLLFAPDWLLSTTRAFTQAFQEGSGVKGLMNPKTLADLHRQYSLRSALFYVTAGGGLNYILSGHTLWDEKQKDWTKIEVGDGRTLGFNKHGLEVVHALTSPAQFAANKLAYFPREAINQISGNEYISAAHKSPPMDTSPGGRLLHAIRAAEPIAVQQGAATGDPASAVSGMLGMPLYGKTDKQRKQEKLDRKKKRDQERGKNK